MSSDQNIENEHDLWRWYTQSYLTKIVSPPNGLSLIIDKLKESDLGNIIGNLKKIFMPEKTNLEEPASKNTPETASKNTPETTPETTSKNTPETTSETTPETTSKNTPETTSETTSVKQDGGGLFCQKDYKIDVYYNFRFDSYNELMSYLTKNHIKISLLTKQLLKKLYLYHYSIDYIKALNYILFKIKEHTLPIELRTGISNLFEQIRNEIYNNLIT